MAENTTNSYIDFALDYSGSVGEAASRLAVHYYPGGCSSTSKESGSRYELRPGLKIRDPAEIIVSRNGDSPNSNLIVRISRELVRRGMEELINQ